MVLPFVPVIATIFMSEIGLSKNNLESPLCSSFISGNWSSVSRGEFLKQVLLVSSYLKNKGIKKMIKIYNILSLFIIAIVIIVPEVSLSSQIKTADDGAEITAIIAKQDLSRIRAIGDRIRAVKKNEGEFTATIDDKLGDIYIRPSGSNDKGINLYLITEKNFTYKLLLHPKDIPSEQIFIKNDSVTLKAGKAKPISGDLYTRRLIKLYIKIT